MNDETKLRESTPENKLAGSSTLNYVSVLLVGVSLVFLFVKSEVAKWEHIHDTFLFRETYMYLIISTAIVVAAVVGVPQ